MAPHRNRRRRLRSLYLWHRWLGLACALLVAWLSVTGILLNHSPALGFDRKHVRAAWLLRAYGITPQSPVQGFQVAGHWITQAGDQLFFNATPIVTLTGELIGAATLAPVILVATPDTLVALSLQGELIEILGSNNLPGTVQAVAGADRQLIIRTAQGLYASGPELRGFVPYRGDWPSQAVSMLPLPAEIAQGIVTAGAGIRLTRERVLSDLHSGRLIGRHGPWIMDLAAAGFIFLALSGLWLWWRNRRVQRLRRRLRQP